MSNGLNNALRGWSGSNIEKTLLSQQLLTCVRIKHDISCDQLHDFNLQLHQKFDQRFVTLDHVNAPVQFRKKYSAQEEAYYLDLPIQAKWVPQGGYCDIPVNPVGHNTLKSNDPFEFVFTVDLSGCSILVDQISKDTYRVYHVQGGSDYLHEEYIKHDHGLGLAGSFTYKDYIKGDHVRAFAYLKYTKGR